MHYDINTQHKGQAMVHIHSYLTYIMFLISAFVHAGSLFAENQLEGYWEVTNRQGQKHSIIYIDYHKGTLQAQGVRVFPTSDGKVEFLCEKCRFTSLYEKPLWSGKYLPLSGFKRKKGANVWTGGRAISPKRGMVFYPRVVFTSLDEGQIQVPFLFFTIRANMKKISKNKAMYGCEERVTAKKLAQWGDLDKKENRQRMLEGIHMSPQRFMKAINAGKICYLPRG